MKSATANFVEKTNSENFMYNSLQLLLKAHLLLEVKVAATAAVDLENFLKRGERYGVGIYFFFAIYNWFY